MPWDPKLFRQTPRMLQMIRAQRENRPPDSVPTTAEAERIAPMVPLWSSGQVPMDPLAADKMKRWFEVNRRTFRKPANQVDDGAP